MEKLTKSNVKQLLPIRVKTSHKGQNGRVLIIGGSVDYFGAPILAALGALNSGSDLVYLLVPHVNFEVTRSYYPDFIVRSYPGEYLNEKAIPVAAELCKKVDAILIGPGVTESPEINKTIATLLNAVLSQPKEEGASRPVIVLDAEAIAAIAHIAHTLPLPLEEAHRIVITPNLHEFHEMIEGEIPDDPHARAALVEQYAKAWGVTVLLKGATDIIATPTHGGATLSETGNAGMTVGGTGDVLAGVTASFAAQHISGASAAKAAAFCVGACGDALSKVKNHSFTATDVALELPYILNEF